MSDDDNNNNNQKMSISDYRKRQYEQNRREMEELRKRGREIREKVNRKYQKKRDEEYLANKVHNTRSKKGAKRKVRKGRKLRKQYNPGTVDNSSSMKELRKALKQITADNDYYDKQQNKADKLVSAKREELDDLRDEGDVSGIREAEQRLEKRLNIAREMRRKVNEIKAEKDSIERYINHLKNEPALEYDRRRRRRRQNELEDLGMDNSQFAKYMKNMESDSASSDPDSEAYVEESSTSSSSSDSDLDFESPSEDEYDYDYKNNNNNSSSTTTTTTTTTTSSRRMPINRKNATSEDVENKAMMKPPAPSPIQKRTKERNEHVDMLQDLARKKSLLDTYKNRNKRLRQLLRETKDEGELKIHKLEYQELLTRVRKLEKEISDTTTKIQNLKKSNIKL